MNELLKQISEWLALYGLKTVGALAILVLGITAAKLVTKLTRRILRRAKVDETLVSFGGNILHFFLLGFVAIAALNQVGFQTASLIAVLGAAGLAVGLALQSNLSSLASGVLILLFRPFKLGDLVELAGVTGTVESIGVLTTDLKLPDGKQAIIPNTKVFSDKLINFATTPNRRIDLVVGIGYGDDLLKAKDVLKQVLAEDPRILATPEPVVQVLELADSSVNLAVRPWVKNSDFWDTRCDLTEKIKLRLDAEGISIPFPQRDVHLFGESAGSAGGVPAQAGFTPGAN